MPTKPKYILRKRFLHTKDDTPWWDIDGNYLEGFLCGRRLVRYFAVPKSATAIIVTIYKHAGPDRVCVTEMNPLHRSWAVVDGRAQMFDQTVLDLLRRRSHGQKVWAGVEYEE